MGPPELGGAGAGLQGTEATLFRLPGLVLLPLGPWRGKVAGQGPSAQVAASRGLVRPVSSEFNLYRWQAKGFRAAQSPQGSRPGAHGASWLRARVRLEVAQGLGDGRAYADVARAAPGASARRQRGRRVRGFPLAGRSGAGGVAGLPRAGGKLADGPGKKRAAEHAASLAAGSWRTERI